MMAVIKKSQLKNLISNLKKKTVYEKTYEYVFTKTSIEKKYSFQRSLNFF